MKNKVTVIIPNFNGFSYLPDCIKALEEQTMQDFEVLVVDNGSTDESAQWLREKQIPTVFLEENTGFSGAVNIGIKKSSTPYVILLNNDTKAGPDYVKELVRAIEKSPRIFSVSSKMIQMYNPELMDDAGDMYSILGWAYQRGVGQSEKKYCRPARIFSACAGAAIYRRQVFAEIGYFDENHFAYLEDLDVGYRARIYGYENVYWPAAVVYHVGSATSGSKYNAFKVKLAARNNIYVNYKNMPLPQLLLNLPFLAAGTAVKYAFFDRLGFAGDYRAGLREGLRTAAGCRKVRYQNRHLKNYVNIQIELLIGTIVYFYEFFSRQWKKIIKK